MKKFQTVFLALFILLCRTEPADCRTWLQTAGPQGVQITNLIVDPTIPSTIYVGSFNSGVYKTTDGGNNWVLASGLPVGADTYMVNMDPSDHNTLYVGIVGSGVFMTTDAGYNWHAINTGLANLSVHMAPAIDPSNPSTMYLGTEWDKFYKSTNGGASWAEFNHPHPGNEVCEVVVDPKNSSIIYAGFHFSEGYSNGGLYKSTDGGANWAPINTGLPDITSSESSINFLTIDPMNSKILYVTNNGGIFKSTDAGQHWTSITSGITTLPPIGLAIHPINTQRIYVGTFGGGVFLSTNGGANWQADNLGLTNLNVIGLAFDPSDPAKLYAGRGSGVFKSNFDNFSGSYPTTDYYDSNIQDGLTIETSPVSYTIAGTTDPQTFEVSFDEGDNHIELPNYSLITPNRLEQPERNHNYGHGSIFVDSLFVSSGFHSAMAFISQETNNPLDIAISAATWANSPPTPFPPGTYTTNIKIMSYSDPNINDTTSGFQQIDASGVFQYTLEANNTLTVSWDNTQVQLQVNGGKASLPAPVNTGISVLHALEYSFDQNGFSYFSIASEPNDPTDISVTIGWGIPDTDNDGVYDDSDSCPNDANNDSDSDGICGDIDNCPNKANANQLDSNNNGKGDACELSIGAILLLLND